MAIIVDQQGKTHPAKPVFLSRSLFEAYNAGKPWDEDAYVLVETKFIWPVWITESESRELSNLSEFEEIAQFAEKLDILAIPKEAFSRWKRGEKET